MSKRRTEINPLRAQRIKELIEIEHISQTEFASRIFQTQQNVSRILNLKSGLTEETARDIVKAFPGTRIEWLLGYDNYRTEADKFAAAVTDAQSEAALMESGLFALAAVAGFTVQPTEPQPDNSVRSILNAIKTGVTFTRDGKSVSMSLAELNTFENELADYVALRLSYMMK